MRTSERALPDRSACGPPSGCRKRAARPAICAVGEGAYDYHFRQFALCTVLAAMGTVLASPVVLWSLVPIAALAAAFPVHPFDLLYNHGLRYLTRTRMLPRRGAPNRFACGIGALWLLVTGWAFHTGHASVGYALGGALTLVGPLVSTTDTCIPLLIYRSILRLSAALEPRRRLISPACRHWECQTTLCRWLTQRS